MTQNCEMQHGETAKSLATVYYEECVERVEGERGERERETETEGFWVDF